MIELVFNAGIAYAVGLIAPGYFCARLLGSRSPWSISVPLSMLILMLGVLALDFTGIPLRFGTVLGWELAVSFALIAAGFRWRPAPPPEPSPPPPALRLPDGLLIAGMALMGLLVIGRGFMVPLSGGDAVFRWEFLARQVLNHQTLAFYPPTTPDDFRTYFYFDGFAPTVAMSYWWIYAACGGLVPQEAVMPLVMAQYFGALVLACHLAAHLHSRRAGLLAGAILAATPLFFRAVMIGQETGLTAIAMAGMMLTLLQAKGPGDTRALVLAGLLAGAGGLAREYGPALAAGGGLVILWRRLGGRAFLLFGLVVLLVILPWSLRNWICCGNPLYDHLRGLFPVNAVADDLMQFYRASIFGFHGYGYADWKTLAKQTLLDAGWQLLVGVPAAVCLVRRHGYLVGGAAVVVALWLVAVGYTAADVRTSMRVLSPAAVLLAVAAAIGMARGLRSAAGQWAAVGAVLLSLPGSAFRAAVFPLTMTWHETDWRTTRSIMTASFRDLAPEQGIERFLPLVLPAGTRFLTENARVHSLLANAGSAYDAVPIWSPEVAFLFDRRLEPAVQRRLLQERNITAALVYRASANTVFCLKYSPFYAQGAAGWQPLGRFKDLFTVYALPPPESAVASSPAEELVNLGNALMLAGCPQEAIKEYEAALRLEPGSAGIHYNLGTALQQAGRMAESAACFREALRLGPDDADTHNNLGITLAQMKQVPEAIREFEAVVRINPDCAEAHHNLAALLAQTGRRAEAQSHYEQALRIKPDFAEARENLNRLQSLRPASGTEN